MATAAFPYFAASFVHSLKVFLHSDLSQLPSQLSPSAVHLFVALSSPFFLSHSVFPQLSLSPSFCSTVALPSLVSLQLSFFGTFSFLSAVTNPPPSLFSPPASWLYIDISHPSNLASTVPSFLHFSVIIREPLDGFCFLKFFSCRMKGRMALYYANLMEQNIGQK